MTMAKDCAHGATGIVHRSPPLVRSGPNRLLVVLTPTVDQDIVAPCGVGSPSAGGPSTPSQALPDGACVRRDYMMMRIHYHMKTALPFSLPHRDGWLDRTGMWASIGCGIHCLIAPVLLLASPALGGWWVHPAAHVLIAALVLPVAGFALRRGFNQHRRRWIVAVGGIGMMLVVIGVLLPWLHTPATLVSAPEAASTGCTACQACCPTLAVDATTGFWSLRVPPASIVTVLGGLALVVAHLANLRCACRGCVGACPVTLKRAEEP